MTIELERTLVKSPPEVWEELASDPGLSRWLDDVQVRHADAPNRIEWAARGAKGMIELEPSGWGTKVRAQAHTAAPGFWDRFRVVDSAEVERRLESLMDHLGASTLTSG
jgi:uncharacterized protein YndB with AHSA1/START domain